MQPRASRNGRGARIDGKRSFVTEEVPDHRAQNERNVGVHDRNGDRLECGEEPRLSVVGDHDRCRLVSAVDRDLLADVVGIRAVQARRAHDDHRLGRQVDVLLVLDDVAGDRLVAELRQLDPDLLGRDPVHAVADDRPRPSRERVTLRGERDRRSPIEDVTHRGGQVPQCREDLVAGGAVALGRVAFAELGRDREREEEARGDLRVERLGRRDAHLQVAAVGRVEHAVALLDEIALAPVDDADHRRTRARTRSTVRLVSAVVPDCEMAMTSMSVMSVARPKPDNSVAATASTVIGRPAQVRRNA